MLPTKHKNLNPAVPRPLDNKGTLPSTKVKALPPENTNFFNNAFCVFCSFFSSDLFCPLPEQMIQIGSVKSDANPTSGRDR